MKNIPNSIVDTGTTGNGENSEERVTKPIRGINSAVVNHEVVPIKSSRWNKALAKVLKFILPKNEGRLEYKGNGQCDLERGPEWCCDAISAGLETYATTP
ncbi:hypothetical protein GQ600_20075 [Phytophthora cactorum]|nr:hypothetical protein GQ600_20075 [Phytophthora cactorum]